MKTKNLSRICGIVLGAVVALVLAVGLLAPGMSPMTFNSAGVYWYPDQEPSKLSEPFNQPTWDRVDENHK